VRNCFCPFAQGHANFHIAPTLASGDTRNWGGEKARVDLAPVVRHVDAAAAQEHGEQGFARLLGSAFVDIEGYLLGGLQEDARPACRHLKASPFQIGAAAFGRGGQGILAGRAGKHAVVFLTKCRSRHGLHAFFEWRDGLASRRAQSRGKTRERHESGAKETGDYTHFAFTPPQS